MRFAIFGLTLFLAACNGGEPRTTDDPVGQNVAAATAEGKSAKLAAAVDCSNLPKFVPIYPGAQVTTCVSSPDGTPGHVSGSVVYKVAAKPDEVLGWSRAQSDASGLGHGALEPGKYVAGEADKRSLMIVVEAMDGGTRATVNWGGEI